MPANSLESLVLALPNKKRAGVLKTLTKEQYAEFENMISVLAALPHDDRPKITDVVNLVERKLNIYIPRSTIYDHIAKKERELRVRAEAAKYKAERAR